MPKIQKFWNACRKHMNEPPIGYDDESIVPKTRLRYLLDEFEDELNKVQKVYHQYIPSSFEFPSDVDQHFWQLRQTAQELGEQYHHLIDKLVFDYQSFKKKPDQINLNQLFADIKSLQLLLVSN